MARLSIKFNINTYDGMVALRGYFFTRLVRNFFKMPFSTYNREEFKQMLALSFCQDYMNAFGSSAIISRIVKYSSAYVVTLGKEDKGIPIALYALGFIPFCHIFLQFINIYYECDPCERLTNLLACFVFLTIILFMYTYTSCWQEAIGSVSFTTIKKHTEYMKVFFMLFIFPGIGAYFFSGLQSSGIAEAKEKCCFHDEPPLPLDYFDDPSSDYDLIAYFAYQLAFFSLLSLFVIAGCMAWSWIYRTDEETEEGFESRLETCLAAITALEMFVSILLFDFISKYCCKITSHRYVLLGMAISNVYCTCYDRGSCIHYNMYSTWKDMQGVFESMKTLGETELADMDEKNCSICDDEIEENGRLADCTHKFHYFCIKEWIGQYGAICPECNKEFKTKKREYAPPEEEEGEEEEGAKLDPKMIEKILSEMEKFDAKSTFFSENGDVVEKKAEEGEGEEEGGEEAG